MVHIDSNAAPALRSQASAESASPVAHTPTPWKVEPDHHFGPGFVITAPGMENRCPVVRMSSPLGEADETLRGDAELIVKAVNSHQELLARIARLEADLLECREHLETEVDVIDGSNGEPTPNRAMALVSMIDQSLSGAKA